MAEVTSMGGTRGRSRGPRGNTRGTPRSTGAAPTESHTDLLEQDGEMGQLKKRYKQQLDTLTELFPDWTIEDLVFAIDETSGDLETTVERITDGSISRFNDVKKKPREKSRAKTATNEFSTDPEQTRSAGGRGGRGRGATEGGRGARGRGDRGRGGAGRGGRGGNGATNGGRSAAAASIPTDSAGWGANSTDTGAASSWDQAPADTWGPGETATTTTTGWDDKATAPSEAKVAPTADTHKTSVIPEGSTKSWASLMATPKQPPPTSNQDAPAVSISEPEGEPAAEKREAVEELYQEPFVTDWGAPQTDDASLSAQQATPKANHAVPDGPTRMVSANLPPPRDSLTEHNLENLPDSSGKPSTETVASTRDPRSTLGSAQPSFYGGQQAPIARPMLSVSAQKSAGPGNRSLSFQRLKEQQDAVVMPGNHAIDRSAVQFGSMNLDGESKPLDADEEREDAETRAQPPQQSPSQPRASLPPAPRAPVAHAEQAPSDTLPTPKHAPGLPTPGQQQPATAAQPHQIPSAPGLMQPSADNPHYSQLGGRYGGGAFGQDPSVPSQRNYDPFSSQLYPQSQNDPQSNYPGLTQPPVSASQPATSQGGSYSHGQADYGSQYPSENARSNYSSYYGAYNQPPTSGQESVPSQRSTSGYSAGESGYGASQPSQPQSRFSEAQASGHNTPNPAMGSQQQHTGSHSQPSQHMPQQSHGHGGYGGHPYGGSYGHSGYYQQYSNQGYPNYYGYNQQGYGGSYGGKGGMYGGQGHHGYGMSSSHGSYDNAHSPATSGAFGNSSLQGRESSMSSGLNDYPRSGSTQPASQTQHTNAGAGFGSMPDSYGGRSSSGFGGHGQGFGNAPTPGGNEEPAKSLHDSKTGPSPLVQAGRPGSGFNTNNANSQGYGPPGNQQQGGFGGSNYPSHLGGLHSQYGSGYGGIGGLGQQGGSHGNQSSYGYGSGFGNNNYGGRGGWSNQYGSQYGQH